MMKYIKSLRKYMDSHPAMWAIIYFLIVGIAASFIFYIRFPNNFIEPNFYAEDGSVYLHNIEKLGFLNATFTTFNGYFVSGLYLIEGLGYTLNAIFSHGSFVDLPRSFSVASYLFLGFVCALPVLLFRRYIKHSALLLIVALSAFVPLPGYDYAIIGTIGNLKFVFVYVAFLLIVYRNLLPASSWRRFIIVDLIVLVCAYTNVVIYLLIPFALLRYLPLLRFDRKKLSKLVRERSFQSLLALGVLLLPQIIVIKLFGIPAIPGYLDTPYQIDATINTFIYRSYLFPFLPGLLSHLNDFLVVVAFVLLNIVLWFGLKRYRALYVFGMFSIFIITLLFVINRTGVSELFKTYLSSGPDQFFYTQNLIICFLAGVAVVELIRKIRSKNIQFTLYGIIGLGFVLLYVPVAGSYGKNDFMQRTVHNIYVNAQHECEQGRGTPNLQLYPVLTSAFPLRDIDRSRICTSDTLSYVPDTQYLAFDMLGGAYIADIGPAKPTQTFKADYNGLSGISIMFLTYKQMIKDDYIADIYTGDCDTKLRSTVVTSKEIKDTTFVRINFAKIDGSRDKLYCLKLAPQGPKSTALALALSKDNLYPEGQLNSDGSPRSDDLMMRLHYSR